MKKDSNIIVYDNVFSHSLRTKLYEKVINSAYHIGWADTKIIENSDKVFMYSEWDAEKYIKSGLLSGIESKELLSKIDNRLPVNCIVYQGGADDDLYIGTDIGVYYKNNLMTEWVPFNDGLPNVIVKELEIHYDKGTISAATFGRGVWESPLNTLSSLTTNNIEKLNYSMEELQT